MYDFPTTEQWVKNVYRNTSTEIIVRAAILVKDATEPYSLPMPYRHHNILSLMRSYGVPIETILEAEQGFITSTGRFVDRTEGQKVVREAFQPIRGKDFIHSSHLFSEDLW